MHNEFDADAAKSFVGIAVFLVLSMNCIVADLTPSQRRLMAVVCAVAAYALMWSVG